MLKQQHPDNPKQREDQKPGFMVISLGYDPGGQ
jgi:hypothetical protein